MKPTEKTIIKKLYYTPKIVCVELDNEIALVLQSQPPLGPGEVASLTPEYLNNDHFQAKTS